MDDEDDPVLERRRIRKARAARRRATILIALGGLAAATAIVLVGIRLANRTNAPGGGGVGIGGPSPTDEGEKWTAVEMRDHLRSKGLNVWMEFQLKHTGSGSHAFVFARSKQHAEDITLDAVNTRLPSPEVVLYDIRPTSEEARRSAGFSPEHSFSWGRFMFSMSDTDKGLARLSEVHQALTGKPFKARP